MHKRELLGVHGDELLEKVDRCGEVGVSQEDDVCHSGIWVWNHIAKATQQRSPSSVSFGDQGIEGGSGRQYP
jgi:hypothetical protein